MEIENLNKQACSIIVPTYNRLDQLKKCVTSILESSFANFELIIVDDCSTDKTANFLKKIKDRRVVTINNKTNLGASGARNLGIKKAQYDRIAFTDDDCIVDKKWLENLLKSFSSPKIGFVIGRTFYVSQNYRAYFPERCVSNSNGQWPGAGNIAYLKKVFEKIGNFDPLFFRSFNNEDTEIAIRAVSYGYKFERSVNAIVYHQKSEWTVSALLNSSKNSSVWPVLKKRYPNHYFVFGHPIKFKIFIKPLDYLYVIFMPILIPALLLRYIWHGKRNLKIFFTKWPLYFFLQRYYIWKEAIKNRILIL